MIRQPILLITMLLMPGYGAMAGTINETNSEQVPFVGCKTDGQQGPQLAPKNDGGAPILPSNIAHDLAYYRSPDIGILAPRGWYCFDASGSGGYALFVTPAPHRPKELFARGFHIMGSGVYLDYAYGDTSGRFEVARVAAGLFPTKRDFVQQVIDEGIVPESEFPYGPYPGDILIRRSDTEVEFETPPGKDGMGAHSWFVGGVDPIKGVATMTKDDDVVQIFVGVPKELNQIIPAILESPH